jgi:uncharacterized protein
MFEQLGLEGWTPLTASVVLGALLGALFGFLGQRSRFCLRRGLVGAEGERSAALGTWLMALAVAVGGTSAIAHYGFVDFSEHRFHASSMPLVAIVVGGLLFGAGMVLTRGCASRLTVLAGTGNLRAVASILVFAVVAHATIKGVLAPLRVWLGGFSVALEGPATLGHIFGGLLIPSVIIVGGLCAFALRSRASWSELAMGAAIGALVPLGWLGTGYLLLDEFDPITLESLSFTSPSSETLFWTVAGTAIAPGFGVGLVAGALAGSFVAALTAGEFAVVGFERSTPTGSYLLGASLMGFGGVLAGGCTIGAGLSGVATLSLAAIAALLAIVAGAILASRLVERQFVFADKGLVAAE